MPANTTTTFLQTLRAPPARWPVTEAANWPNGALALRILLDEGTMRVAKLQERLASERMTFVAASKAIAGIAEAGFATISGPPAAEEIAITDEGRESVSHR